VPQRSSRFAGALRAYSTHSGSILWEYDTNRDFQTVNGVAARGASMHSCGPAIAGGMLFVNSGYDSTVYSSLGDQ